MPKFEIAKLKLDLPKVEVPKPVYAGAGAARLAVATVKGYADTVSKKVAGDVTTRVSGYQKQVAGFEPRSFAQAGVDALTAEAKARRIALESAVTGLQADAKALPGKVTSFYKATSSEALGAYQDLAKRGEVLVARLRREAPTEVTVSVKGTTDTPAKKAPAKKAPAKKAPAATQAPAKTASAAKKTTAKKAPAKKAPAKTAPAKKAPAATKAPASTSTPADKA